MTALSANKKTARREPVSVLIGLFGAMPVAASTHVYAGGMAALNVSGYIVPASADPTLVILGAFEAEADNSSGSAGALTVDVRRGCFLMVNSSSTDALTVADIGRACFAVDDQTVARTPSNGLRPVAGRVVDVTSDGVWVELGVNPLDHGAVDIYLIAGADLSTTGQFLAMAQASDGTVNVCSTTGGDCVGVLQNAPTSGAVARVRIAGLSKLYASGSINPGVRIASNNAGKSKAAVVAAVSGANCTGSYCMGIAQTTGASNALHQVLLQPLGLLPSSAA